MIKKAATLGALILSLAAAKPGQADTICVAANFDGNTSRAASVAEECEKSDADAILLMGDYSRRGPADLSSTHNVLKQFSKERMPTYILSGSNDNPSHVDQIAERYGSLHALHSNQPTRVADLLVLPLNGYNNRRFMFPGAHHVGEQEWDAYLSELDAMPENLVSVSHISPHGHVDRIKSGAHVGERSLEKVLRQNNIDSISAAIRESPGTYPLTNRCKINPGYNTILLETDGNGSLFCGD